MLRYAKTAMLLIVLPCAVNAQTITTVAGTGATGNTGDGGSALAANIDYPSGMAFDKEGNLYIALGNAGHKVRKISPTGMISTYAGTGIAGYSGDTNPATSAKLKNPPNVAVDTGGNIFISDAGNNVIRRVDKSTGLITTIAGTGAMGYSGDGGPATAALLNSPNGICFDEFNNLYIGDNGNYRIRKVNNLGIISLVAGDGTIGYGGDGSIATASPIYGVFGLCADSKNNLYLSDGRSRVCKINASGIISTFAGTSVSGSVGDGGAATSAQTYPLRIAFDPIGNLFIAENSPYNKVRVVDTFGIIHTAAGSGASSFGGDGGPATAAAIYYPSGVAVDACGNLFISDLNNRRIRKVSYPPVLTTPSIVLSGSISSAPVGTVVTVNATISNAGSSYLLRWMNKGIEFVTTTIPTVTYTKGTGTDTITARVVSTATYGCYDSTTSTPHLVSASNVGLEQFAYEQGLQVYPNPAHDVITISSSGTLLHNVSISNLLGREVVYREGGASTEMQLAIGHLPQGIYLVRVNGIYVRRFVKE